MRFRIIKSGGYYREQIKRWWGWQNLHMAAETTPEACERNIRRYLDPENGKIFKEFNVTISKSSGKPKG